MKVARIIPIALVLLVVLVSFVVSGCAQTQPAAPAPTAAPAADAPAPTTAAKPADSAAAPEAGSLSVTGLVGKPLTLSLDDLKKMNVEKITAEHPKKGKQEYQGIRLSAVLDAAQVKPEAKTLVMTASDGFKAEVQLSAVKAAPDCLVAIDDKGALSTVMPGMEGNTWVKNVEKIEVK